MMVIVVVMNNYDYENSHDGEKSNNGGDINNVLRVSDIAAEVSD